MSGAFVSGQDRVAVFLKGRQAWCVRLQSPAPQPISPGLLPYLFESVDRAIYHSQATIASTAELLEIACREERGLQLALISMDPISSVETRELSEDALEEFLEDPRISEFIENRLFSQRLPQGAQWSSDLATGDLSAYSRVTRLKRSVLDAQQAIGRVRTAWDALPEDLFAESGDRDSFELVLIETGAFRVLAILVSETGGLYGKRDALAQLRSDPRFEEFTNSRNILLAWAKSISNSPEPVTSQRPSISRAKPSARGNTQSQRMTQTQLVRSLAEICEINNETAYGFLDKFANVAIAEVKKNGVFVMPGIGRLVRVDRKARLGRNPATGEAIKIPAKKVVKFRVAKAAKDAIIPPKKVK